MLPVMFAVNMNAQTQQEDPDLTYAVDMLKPGEAAPAFTLNDIQGNPCSIGSFAGRKVVLVFWASWCPDCRKEVPELKAMQAAADPGKVAFVSVSFDRTFEAFETYVKENYIGGVQLFDPAGKKESAVGADYHVKWIPSLYLIDEEGKVILGTVVAEKVAKALGLNQPGGNSEFSGCNENSCEIKLN